MKFDRIYTEIDLGHIEENMEAMEKNLRPGTKMYGVVKTDAYGHGAVPVAKTIDRFVCGYAVATVEEGVQLRKHGITKEILILGPVAAPRYEECIRQELCMPVFELDKAEGMSEAAEKLEKTRPYRGGYRNEPDRTQTGHGVRGDGKKDRGASGSEDRRHVHAFCESG